MGRKVVITCAVTGGGDTVRFNPAVPVSPAQIAQASVDAARAGAAVAHIHVRDPATGKGSMESSLYREVVARIRESGVEVLLNLTAGMGGNFVPRSSNPSRAGPGTTLTTPAVRIQHLLESTPELCSLDMGSMNKGDDQVFINTPDQLRWMAAAVRAAGVKPELEVFEMGHILLARQLMEEGLIDQPPVFQICLGMPWLAPPTTESMLAMRGLLPPGAVWFTFAKGPAIYPMLAQGVLLGAHVRIGFEDTVHIAEGELAKSNAALVEKAVKLVELLGASPASAGEARDILGLPQTRTARQPATE